ncbi:MAG: threonylcarbamoyl-AMP synthase [Ignavibacteriae bacterium]|nr:MAG: threonylcarbamoyl-AMP synthase [Ignavibacteriota bacterium]
MKTILISDVQEAVPYIEKSQVVAFPTETVYGLGANTYDEKAINKIFEAKGRPQDNPLIVHIADKKQVNVLAVEVNSVAKKIIKEFFPGPITIILKKNEIIPDNVTAGLDTIAIRMPASKIARDFIKACDVPIAAPSANLSGSPSPTQFTHVMQDFAGKIPCIIIGPPSQYGLESTVLDCTTEKPEILRPGIITAEDLKKAGIDVINSYSFFKDGIVKSPGQKYRHYAPKAKVKIYSGSKDIKPDSAFIGITALDKKIQEQFKKLKICKNLLEYAKNLFSFFRDCDEKGIQFIYVQKVEEKGIGMAIMNRLKKAVG